MNWYLQSTDNSDVVKSTRISFLRNIGEFKFNLEKKDEIEKLENKIKDKLFSIGYGLKYFKLKDMDEITRTSLVEKNLITPEFAFKKVETGSILINDDENICIMIGGKDHLNIQVFSAGLDLENALNLAIEIDEKIGDALGYAVSKKYGYLTSSPSDLGTGLKASVTVYLPALSKTRNTRKIFDAISSFGMSVRGINGDNNQNQGYIYKISNKQTLGITENEIIKNLKVITNTVLEQERQARKLLTKDIIDLEDEIYRSYGIFTNARKISYDESINLLANIKLGVDLGILDSITDMQVQKLYLYTKPANLQKYLGEKCERIDIDIKRAEVIKKIIENK